MCYIFVTELTKGITDQREMMSTEINSICFRENEINDEMLANLPIFGVKYKNSVFDFEWKQNSTVSINSWADVYDKIWKPTIDRCKKILTEICDKSYKLDNFLKFKATGDHLEKLCLAMMECGYWSDSQPDFNKWITEVKAHITVFLKVFSNLQSNGIEYCMKLKEQLELKGDFSSLDVLHKFVSLFRHAQ